MDDVVARLRAAGCVFAEEEAVLLLAAAGTAEELEAMLARREEGVPLEHVLGWAEFGGVRVVVAEGVFVPRRRTEHLVDQAAGIAGRGAVVVDLCCGSGAIGAALASRVPGLRVHAVDVDPAAVACARRNLAPHGGKVYAGDLFAPLPDELRGAVDLVVACPPYVPSGAIQLMPPEAREHEPLAALDGGADGLDVVRRIAQGAGRWLAAAGHLVVETSERQAPEAVRILTAHGLTAWAVASEDGDATVVVGTPAGTCAGPCAGVD